MQPQEVLAVDVGAAAGAIAVWIDLANEREAKLYFRHSRADRFFLRTLPLPRSLDEVAREEIAHVVATAVVALSKGSEDALTRSEARTAWQGPAAANVQLKQNGRALQWQAALWMGGYLFAREAPFAASTSGLIGATHRLSSRSALGGWAGLGYQLTVDDQQNLVRAKVGSMALRMGLLYVADLHRRSRLRVALGAGVERIHHASAANRNEVTAGPAGAFYIPATTCAVDFEVDLVAGLALTLRVAADVLLETTHFDLKDEDTGVLSRVLRLYSFRPGAGLGLAYRY